jgi:hypothetical protein
MGFNPPTGEARLLLLPAAGGSRDDRPDCPWPMPRSLVEGPRQSQTPKKSRRANVTQFQFVAYSAELTQIFRRGSNARAISKERQLKDTQDMGGFVTLLAVIGIILLMSTVVGASIFRQ